LKSWDSANLKGFIFSPWVEPSANEIACIHPMKGKKMSTELEGIVTKMFEELDKLDVENFLAFFSEEVQWVDEFSRKWSRGGKKNLEEFFSEVVKTISEMKSTPSDIHTVMHDDVALVTLLLTQTYTHQGNEVDIQAPTTIGFVRENGAWKVSVLHSIPLT